MTPKSKSKSKPLPIARSSVVVVTAVLALSPACSSEDSSGGADSPEPVASTAKGERVSDDEAIRIAEEEIAGAFEDFDFSDRRPQVIPVGKTLDVSFPSGAGDMLDEEPHVIIDSATGRVLRRELRG